MRHNHLLQCLVSSLVASAAGSLFLKVKRWDVESVSRTHLAVPPALERVMETPSFVL
jgi:hypothetical protein